MAHRGVCAPQLYSLGVMRMCGVHKIVLRGLLDGRLGHSPWTDQKGYIHTLLIPRTTTSTIADLRRME